MNKARVGSTLDSMFEEQGELEEVEILTQKKILARKLEQVRRTEKISVSELARRMGTSRMAVHSLLHPTKPTVTIDSVSRAASALGAKFEMRVVAKRAGSKRTVKGRRAQAR